MALADLPSLPPLSAGGVPLDLSGERFGFLRQSADALDDFLELRARMEADGYLFLPGFLDPEPILAVRRAVLERLAEEGALDPNAPLMEGIAAPGLQMAFRPDIANETAARPLLEEAIYGGRMMAFWDGFFGEPALHYDFSWLRAVAPGRGTAPHCDAVYMNRGTTELYTAWVPLGDVPLTTGGLVVVEGSHRDDELRRRYTALDVDAHCEDAPDGLSPLERAGYERGGAIAGSLVPVGERLGGRLLTAREFHPGDALFFSCFLVHGSLDNGGDRVRLSSDSRYQRASAPVDERWVRPAPHLPPPGHGGKMVRGVIC